MASIARKSEYVVATIAVLLGLSSLVGACSNSRSQSETTGSIGSARAQQAPSYGSNPPPAIGAPQTTASAAYAPPPAYAAAQPQRAAYRPRYRQAYKPTSSCACPPQGKAYGGGDVTASIPQTQQTYAGNGQANFIVHPIAPRDTLYSISRHYRTSMDDIATVNRIRPDSPLRVGELLVVPTGLR